MSEMRSGDPLVGRVFDRRYRIDQRLVIAGMTMRYRASQPDTGAPCFIVVPTFTGPRIDARQRAEFHKATRLCKQLPRETSDIARLLDHGETITGLPWRAFEALSGRELSRMASGRRMSPQHAASIALTVAEAMVEAHAANLGLGPIDSRDLVLDRAEGQLIVGIVPREPVRGDETVFAADLNTLGRLLIELLAGGRTRHVTPTPGEAQHVNRLLQTSAGGAAEEWRELLGRLVTTSDEHRAQSAAEAVIKLYRLTG